MSTASYNQRHKDVLDSFMLDQPEVRAGKMFGRPAYYVGKKLFACVYGDAVGVKVPEESAEELLKKRHIASFQPMGRARMREWIQLNRKRSGDYIKDKKTFLASISFVSSLAEQDKAR